LGLTLNFSADVWFKELSRIDTIVNLSSINKFRYTELFLLQPTGADSCKTVVYNRTKTKIVSKKSYYFPVPNI